MATKVKVTTAKLPLLGAFDGMIGILSGFKGTSGTTERVDLDGGKALYLTPEQYVVVPA